MSSDHSRSHSHAGIPAIPNPLRQLNPFQKKPNPSIMGGGTAPTPQTGYPKLNFTPKGQQVRSIYQGRIKNFTATGQYESVNLRSMWNKDREDSSEYVKLASYSVPDLKRPTFEEAMKGTFKPISKGHKFGPSWSTHWVRVKLTVPERMNDQERLYFQWDAGCEGMIWTDDGEPLQGLTGGGERPEWLFPVGWRDGRKHVFYVEVACNAMFGNAEGDIIQPPNPNRYFTLNTADIVAPNMDARALFIDMWIMGDASREFPGDSWEGRRATQVCNDVVNAFVPGSQESIKECRKIAAQYIGDKVDSAKVYDSGLKPIVFATGHCHIDTAWLWPFDETKRKVARSWSSQCDLIDRYPEHRFTASSAQQYKWLETLYPKLFDRVRDKVNKGKFQYIGGSWVEHDTNMPGGESLTRQFLLGQRYFQSRFGERSTTFWLPDTFGYSSQLPQLCRLAGMTRFFTQKLSWNNINSFPHTTFNWISLDGSQVLCHMPPSETYTAEAHFGDVKRSVSNHKSMDQDETSLLVFGKGDGGGGPTYEQLEKLRRARGISDNIGLLPRMTMGTSVDEFFETLEKKELTSKNKFVTWFGELYLEFHRGTYTSQSNNKKNNRKAEIMMKDLEMIAAYASVAVDSYQYPKAEIDAIWEDMCLCQFHDCLPGSCIEMVYRDTDRMYAALFKKGFKLLKEATDALGVKSEPFPHSKALGLNTFPWGRTEVITVPKTASNVKQTAGTHGYILVSAEGPGLAKEAVLPQSPKVTVIEVSKDVYVLANEKLMVTVKEGVIISLVHLPTGRETIPEGSKAGQLVLFDDQPLYWQAWDVEVYHTESRKELSAGEVTLLESGPLRASLLVKTEISKNSWINTTISLDAATDSGSGNHVVFDCKVEWQEKMKFLKVEFPVDIYNTEASYETQYGLIRRPTHYNTTWDMAKFEVCCHKWADLSEYGFGMSILNDCKYGFATSGNLMTLSLLRAPKAPDAHADMGRHTFKYAILPHEGAVGPETVRTAANFNNPIQVSYAAPERIDKVQDILSSVTVSGASSIILDTIKRGEDDEDVSTGGLPVRDGKSVILRFYESLGGKATTTIHSKLPVKKVYKTNLLEDDGEEVKIEEIEINGEKTKSFKATLRGFEVATYRLQL